MPETSFDPAWLARLGRLDLIARTVVQGFLSGIHASPYKGFSIEFAEHRQYYPGDELRHIDWRAWGKTDRFFIKQHEEETNLRCTLIVDASASMGYRGKGVSKFQYATMAAATLAYLMLRQRDSVGLALHDREFRTFLRPRNHPKQWPYLLRVLNEAAPLGESDLGGVWDRTARRIPPRGLVIFLTDGFGQIERMIAALRHFRHRGHDVIFFQILDPHEIEFPFQNASLFRDMENTSLARQADAATVRKAYQANLGSFLDTLRRHAGELGVDYHLLRTDTPLDRALSNYLAHRRAWR